MMRGVRATSSFFFYIPSGENCTFRDDAPRLRFRNKVSASKSAALATDNEACNNRKRGPTHCEGTRRAPPMDDLSAFVRRTSPPVGKCSSRHSFCAIDVPSPLAAHLVLITYFLLSFFLSFLFLFFFFLIHLSSRDRKVHAPPRTHAGSRKRRRQTRHRGGRRFEKCSSRDHRRPTTRTHRRSTVEEVRERESSQNGKESDDGVVKNQTEKKEKKNSSDQ